MGVPNSLRDAAAKTDVGRERESFYIRALQSEGILSPDLKDQRRLIEASGAKHR